ncbi:uncharacterized protein LOC125383232 isoform X2 [Haliotis rufescens]|uniref:uncharacterized protein LOC125383232 isoform X2 n=1 Tax=Haliotis rufescens TaxID=6454 RepID=UPI00201EDC3E|nr:uncharacterized protein LOC125383232 isoform X2 [Haliotis rufescens]
MMLEGRTILQAAFVSALLAATASPAMYSAALGTVPSTVQYLSPTWAFTPVTYRSGQDTTRRSFEKSWIIDTGNQQRSVLVRFVESTINCPNDFIKIFDGTSTSSSVLGNLCDNGTKTFQSTGETVRILFHSEGAAPGTIKFKYRAAVPTSTSSAVKIGLLVGGSFGVIICFAFLGFFIFCLYRKRKGEKDLINTPIICDSSASGGRDNDGYEDVFLHADMTEESGDNQVRSGPRGGNSRRGDHDTEHMGRPVFNNNAYQAGERNEKEDELRHGDKPIHIHENNQRMERHLDHGNRSRPDHPDAERSDGPQDDHDMHQARGRKTRGDWPGRDDRGTRGGRGDHVVGRHGGAREAYSEGKRDVTAGSNSSRIFADVEINDMEPVIRGGKLILRQSSMEGDII